LIYADNKLAMKLFGSKKALMKERVRQKAAGHWIIHPCSSFRFLLIPSAVSSNIHPCSSFRCSFIPAPDLGTYPSLLKFPVLIHP